MTAKRLRKGALMVEVVNLRTCEDWGKAGDVRIDRQTKWGNPYPMHHESMRDEVCDKYEKWFETMELGRCRDIAELKGAKRLGCWCKPLRCHGDYLKKRIELLLLKEEICVD